MSEDVTENTMLVCSTGGRGGWDYKTDDFVSYCIVRVPALHCAYGKYHGFTNRNNIFQRAGIQTGASALV